MRRFAALLIAFVACAGPAPPRHTGLLHVVVAGDSVAHGAGDESGLGLARNIDRELVRFGVEHEPTSDIAISGSRTSGLAHVIAQQRALLASADAIVVSIGGNDLNGDSAARLMSMLAPRVMMDVTVERVASIVRTLERESQARIVLLGLYDPYRQPRLDAEVSLWSAKLLERFADDRRVQVITIADLFTARPRISPIDRFHPNADAYARIARRVAEAL